MPTYATLMQLIIINLIFSLLCSPVSAKTVSPSQTKLALRRITTAPDISLALFRIADAATKEFPEKLTADNFAISLIVDADTNPQIGGYHQQQPFYPASVIKLCYAVALEHEFLDRKIARDAAILSDLGLMLHVSSNAATNRILDKLTQTESGPELPSDEFAVFASKRQSVNNYLRTLGFRNVNACQKTWDSEPFGRDTQFLGSNFENRNRMTCEEIAKLLWLIRHNKVVSSEGCREILSKLYRKPGDPKDIQGRRIGAGIPAESRLWSKAGWTDNSNHDAAYVELPKGNPFVLVIFSKTSWKDSSIISWITKRIVSDIQLGRISPQSIGAMVFQCRNQKAVQ